MRKLSQEFMDDLQDGMLSPILEKVRKDRDLDLYVRKNYINIYFKGYSLLKLHRRTKSSYIVSIHEKFVKDLTISHLDSQDSVNDFLKTIPTLKDNISENTTSLEIEYEQLIVRANNLELRNDSDYFIVDRQYSIQRYRFDLLGIYLKRGLGIQNEAQPCLIEVKFARNSQIADVQKQLKTYYELIESRTENIIQEMELVFRQRLDLQLYKQPEDKLQILKQLKFSHDIRDFQFVIILVDYDPNSGALNLDAIKDLPFANQVKVFFTGFGMWEQKLQNIKTQG